MSQSEHYAFDGDPAGVAAYTTAGTCDSVPCGAHRDTWGDLERDYAQADQYERALTVAIIAGVCGACPALAECATWATLDRYTGFAAGTWYRAGRPTSERRPGRRSKRALPTVTVPVS